MRPSLPAVQKLFNSDPTLEDIRSSIEHFVPGTLEFDANLVIFVSALLGTDDQTTARLAMVSPEFVRSVMAVLKHSQLDLTSESHEWRSQNPAIAHTAIVQHVMIGAGNLFREWDEDLKEYTYFDSKVVAALKRVNAYEAAVAHSQMCDECQADAAK
jgi:hypothetical protein